MKMMNSDWPKKMSFQDPAEEIKKGGGYKGGRKGKSKVAERGGSGRLLRLAVHVRLPVWGGGEGKRGEGQRKGKTKLLLTKVPMELTIWRMRLGGESKRNDAKKTSYARGNGIRSKFPCTHGPLEWLKSFQRCQGKVGKGMWRQERTRQKVRMVAPAFAINLISLHINHVFTFCKGRGG